MFSDLLRGDRERYGLTVDQAARNRKPDRRASELVVAAETIVSSRWGPVGRGDVLPVDHPVVAIDRICSCR